MPLLFSNLRLKDQQILATSLNEFKLYAKILEDGLPIKSLLFVKELLCLTYVKLSLHTYI